jgi:hypothetical protein
MRKTLLVSIVFILYFTFIPAFAGDDSDYEAGSESGYDYEEVKEDGKTTKKLRRGKVKSKKVNEVGSITESEVDDLTTRRQAKRFWIFGIGPGVGANLGSNELLYGISLGHDWEVWEYGDIRLKGDFSISDNGTPYFTSITLGPGIFFLKGPLSPVIGVNFGVGFADGDSTDFQFGFAGGGYLGLRMFRTSDTQLELSAGYDIIFKKNDRGIPGVFVTRLSLFF